MNSERSPFLLVSVAGLLGAAGVSLAAVAAHRVESPALATAATMLMIHAAAGVAIATLAAASHHPKRWIVIGAFMLAAVTLFSGDIALNTMAGFHVFPMAAPTGGSLLIASWLAVAVCALIEFKSARREP
jgi:uncharacterized membrane protein YgdD (TMEM256/DUF423 family)